MREMLEVSAIVIATVAFTANCACAQNYPVKPVRLIVPTAPSGGTDLVARMVAQKFVETLGQPGVVENRGGANGIIGTDAVAKAAPDGYTVLVTLASYHATNSTLYAKLPYDTVADFAPVSLLAEYPYVLTVHPSLPVKTTREFIAFVKSRPGQLSYASSGNGSVPHLGMELFKSMAGIDLVHVPYKGAGHAMTDHVSGQVPIFLNNFLAGMPMMKAGRLRPLAVTSAKRSIAMPDLPTVAESGLPGYIVTGWYGMLVPAKTPPAVVKALHDGTVKALRAKDVSDRLTSEAAEIVAGTPQQFTDFLKAEISKWAGVIKRIGLKFESY
jgi:tripartite-type tricarboxylate transporter receptor subunit TctC